MSLRFRSDVVAGMSPEVLAALAEANADDALPFGRDPISECLLERFAETFERPVRVFLVSSGTAANAIALGSIAAPGRAILCHEHSHVFDSEAGAVEFFTQGARLVHIAARDGKLQPAALTEVVSGHNPRGVGLPPVALTLTQLTEWGVAYAPEEIRSLACLAHEHGLAVHMDGARIANAVAALGCRIADVTWRVGVDVVTFGGTKNGAAACDAIVVFDDSIAHSVEERVHRSGHRIAKARFLAVQMAALLKDGVWLRNATRANQMAQRLAGGLGQLEGVSLTRPVDGNIVFAAIPTHITEHLRRSGIELWLWHRLADGSPVFRLVTSFRTTAAEVDQIIEAARGGRYTRV